MLDTVHDDADVTVISRCDGADAVVMSFDYYQSIMETLHLLASPANAAHLAKSISQHKSGKARQGGANWRKIRHESGNQVYARHVGRLHLLARARQKTLKPINLLIEAARREPFSGIGKPEPLLGNLSGYWSRRIDDTHLLVYAVEDADFDVIACRGHYDA